MNYFSVICDLKAAGGLTGIYAEWPSTTLNISQVSATAGYWIQQSNWLHAGDGTWLEFGDTAGTGNMMFNSNAWERHWFWVDGSHGMAGYAEWDIQLAPSDGLNRAWGMQWETDHWTMYIGGVPKVIVNQWRSPSTFSAPRFTQGMEIFNGQAAGHARPLDSGMNSAVFLAQRHQFRDASSAWFFLNAVYLQVDSPCGTAPTCLQGWIVPGQGFNNAKPAS